MMGEVVIPKKALNLIMRFLKDEISRLQNELATINEELLTLEAKYGISSNDFIKMLREDKKWVLQEGSEPDVVEWEALIEQRRRIRKKLEELEELWRQLQDYSRS